MKAKVKLIITAFSLIPSIATAEGLPLKELLNVALKNNPQIQITEKDYKIARYEQKEAIGKFLPKIELQYSRIFQSDVPEINLSLPAPGLPPQQFPLIEKNYYSFKATLTQPLFTGGYLYYNYKIKSKEEKAVKFQMKAKVNEIKKIIKKDYYSLSEAKTAVDIAKSYVKAARKHLQDAEAFYKEGIVPRRDLLEAKVKYHEALEFLSKARSGYEVALEKLKTDIGVKTVKIDVKKLTYKPLKLDTEKLIETAYQNNPLIKFLKLKKEEANYGVRIAYSQFLPKVAAVIGYERTDQYPGIDKFDETFGALTINVPIFEGTQRYWRTLKAKETKQKVDLSLKEAKDKIKLGIVAAVSKIKSAESRIKTAEAMVEEAKELLKDSEERYKAQVGTSTEVCDAMAYFTKAKGMLNSAIADYNKALAELEYYTGTEIIQKQ
ncbi:TolC family protein [Desulfurobacterium atlanticum]|uniref:Outer membrane protein TolC n=1 Tax=Desulfurobacterium atlanticum TaxID=240169 RepID=A0A238Y293_9BACT|nr:TolC family protein [Desulfurobacterium atlanticum]SNR64911.1 Outer membrane protein TolC [Desulfurobacterium atlanticum]